MNKKGLRAAIFQAITDRISTEPTDGIAADGMHRESVELEQRAYIAGMRSARLVALRVVQEWGDQEQEHTHAVVEGP